MEVGHELFVVVLVSSSRAPLALQLRVSPEGALTASAPAICLDTRPV